MKQFKTQLFILVCLLIIGGNQKANAQKTPVDYVNPYMGNISHMLVPTFPMVHLPNSMLRIRPERGSYTESNIHGLQVFTPTHRGGSVFRISPFQGNINGLHPIISSTFDNEQVKPYHYSVYLDQLGVGVEFAPSSQSAIYELSFEGNDESFIVFHSGRGSLNYDGEAISGMQYLGHQTNVYWYLETDEKPIKKGYLSGDKTVFEQNTIENKANIVLGFGTGNKKIKARYGISFISVEQAKRNLQREITDYDLQNLAKKGREIWNNSLGKIMVKGGSEDQKTVFYTSLYRTYERMINISEDGKYWSGADKQIHNDNGEPFYVDDWVWDTYLATHPLRTIIETNMQANILSSYIRMSQQNKEGWMPTFPEVTHDSHRMNGNHGVALFADAANKGIYFDMEAAYEACKRSILEETHAPWTRRPAGEFDQYYKDHGYFPALHEGEKETLDGIHGGEKRQSVAVTLGASYDDYCMAVLAQKLGKNDDYNYFRDRSFNYRNLFNRETSFFHPKDSNGKFIEPFNYKHSGGLGARDYYDENNGWTFRWDVKHNVKDLIDLMGGNDKFCNNLDQLFNEDLGMIKWDFVGLLPDQTGNVGQFSMGNEPSFHIPYLYNYAGRPWETQKRVRTLLDQWFRNDLMGVPGDEDGGGMSAFVVFSAMGFYPVTPGNPTYNIGSPIFSEIEITLENGKTFWVVANNCSRENKYIQSAELNGKPYNKTWFSHNAIMNGGKLVLKMGDKANKQWGVEQSSAPFPLSE
ncbi:GH92 family glycosyl hydrolase [Sunxiuqinia sp. sy24]|uniref:GH92 family glycosyl hydrolase n=1 Tax=Sunxiuqinia sp. sy24 TaxID=3461495 RepID=UPI0040457364